MVEPTSMPALEPRGSDETYQPLSGLAIAGLILSASFTLLVAVYGVVGMLARSPVLLSPWLLLLPVAGIALSFLARQQIRRSEGTRAGMRLAGVGMWLGVLFGLGYTAYFIATHFSIRRQAQAFLVDPRDGFFTKLKSPARFNEAFLLTLPPAMRDPSISVRDDDRMERHYNSLPRFRDHTLVRVVHQGGRESETVIEGVSDSDHDQQGWFVRLNVRVQTPYEELPAEVVVRRQDLPSGESEWYVDMTQTRADPYRTKWTKLGENLLQLRVWSHALAAKWIANLNQGKLDDVLQDACKAADFALQENGKEKVRVKGIVLDKITNKKIRQQIRQLFKPGEVSPELRFDGRFPCCVRDKDQRDQFPLLADWEIDPQTRHLRVTHDFHLTLLDEGRRPTARCLTRVVVESKEPVALDAERSRSPDWCVVRLEIVNYRDAAAEQAAGPGGAGQ